jgi:hypothetical protein
MKPRNMQAKISWGLSKIHAMIEGLDLSCSHTEELSQLGYYGLHEWITVWETQLYFWHRRVRRGVLGKRYRCRQ